MSTYKYMFLYSLALVTLSCKKFVTVGPPRTSLVATNVFNDNSTATAAQLGIYTQMQGVPGIIENITALSSDEFNTYSQDPGTLSYYTNSLSASVNPPD